MSNSNSKEAVYIIIPVHNRKKTTMKCLEHLKQCSDIEQYHIVIVDDGSTDGTKGAVSNSYPEVEILDGNGDLWWTGAMAKGMEYAYERGAEYFIWLNDDCLPASNTLKEMVTFMRLNPDTLVAPSCYPETTNFLLPQHNGFQNRKSCAANPGEIIYVEGMSGWCVGIPSTVLSKIGTPDAKRFPHYSGDDMYTFRATKAGFKACLLGDLKVTLFGHVHANLKFKDYFKPGRSFIRTFRTLFFDKKSPYRLQTKFFFFIERYGFFLGLCLFAIKTMNWFVKWAKFQLMLNFQLIN